MSESGNTMLMRRRGTVRLIDMYSSVLVEESDSKAVFKSLSSHTLT